MSNTSWWVPATLRRGQALALAIRFPAGRTPTPQEHADLLAARVAELVEAAEPAELAAVAELVPGQEPEALAQAPELQEKVARVDWAREAPARELAGEELEELEGESLLGLAEKL